MPTHVQLKVAKIKEKLRNLTYMAWRVRAKSKGAATTIAATPDPTASMMPEAPNWSQHRIPSTTQPPIGMGAK